MKLRIDEAEAALIAALQDSDDLAYVPDASIGTASVDSVDFENDQVVAIPPAILVFSPGGSYTARTAHETNYTARERFHLIAVAANYRGPGAAKRGDPADASVRGVYDIIEDMKTALAGKTITTDNGAEVIVTITGWEFRGVNKNQHYVADLQVTVRGDYDNQGVRT